MGNAPKKFRLAHRLTAGLAVGAAFSLVAASCGGDDSGNGVTAGGLGDPGDCVVVDMAVSSEKIDLMTELAGSFNADGATVGDTCIFVRPQSKASGKAASLLSTEWNEDEDGPKPVIWSPAASSWGAIVNQRLGDTETALVPTNFTSFMLTPLVIAMPKPMADAIGYPETPIGWADILKLSTDKTGWDSVGHPEWGPFRLGKTNPNFSTSGLSALIAQTYAATGKTEGLSAEDLANPEVAKFGTDIESAVVHYGDTTLTFLNNWFRADQQGTSLTYASAAAVEEKSVIDYNAGNPDGVLEPGEEARPPKIPLVAIYPSEGTLYSDNPFFILNAEWASDEQRQAASQFEDYVQQPDVQKRVLDFGFRPGNPTVDIDDPISGDNGVDPLQPSTLFEVPSPAIMVKLLEAWDVQRKSGRVLLVLDVSGSMSEEGADGETKLDLARTAIIDALDDFKDLDDVGLRIFTTGLGPDQNKNFVDTVDIEPIGQNREAMATALRNLIPMQATPLYEVALASYETMLADYDDTRINAVILLTDGVNDDGDSSNDAQQKRTLIETIANGSTGELAKPVRVFTVGYGENADGDALAEIAEASNGASYLATDASTISAVFDQVVSNF